MVALIRELGRYEPRTSEEAADVGRVRSLLRSAADPWSRSTPLHVTGSALVVHPSSRRVLLRWHARQQAWLQIGGHVDPGEVHPLTTALREGAEETGLTDLVAWPDASIAHVVIVDVAAAKGEPAHEHADVRFVLATETPEAIEPESPEARLRWLSVEEAKGVTAEENLRETLTRVGGLLG
ncbi:NUDIX hydrolase [Qaidamihabitans albus]|uniref:NUDIX hydrolase n=1 Tax=Qaidamihabitans albus TaxID=2795733 RepID=UPI0018F1250B|nr:NUDIX domain-containing protein [Qaidamihabitans albus]